MSVARIKRLVLMPLVGLIFTLTTFFTPILTPATYAEPVDNPTDTIEDDPDSTTNEPTPTDTSNDTDTPRDETTNESPSDSTSCTDQVGAIGWIVCPTTGFLANAIDALYGAIEGLLIVQPLSSDTDSPIFIVWNYARNISNIVFVILLLVIIYSQVTGLGIKNYGIKRTLPRIVIAAILVNLSFIAASIAVDISNIFGASIRDFLASVGESAIASGAIDPNIDIDVADVFATVATGGTILGVSVGVVGGFSALLALLIPVIIGGVISVAIGLFTISLRQSVISLLVMISPLAFVAYLLPNTEKYFKKWYKLFMQMVIFYPMFSLLFGASRLAGWVIMAGAENALSIILGIAVQIFPLFLGVSLMKMSGTVLGSVSGFLAGTGAHVTNASRGLANGLHASGRANYLAHTASKFNLPRRAAQFLEENKLMREYHANQNLANMKQRAAGRAVNQYWNEDKTEYTKLGKRYYADLQKNMQAANDIAYSNARFDQGLSNFAGSDPQQQQEAEMLDMAMVQTADEAKQVAQYAAQVSLENQRSYASRVHDAYKADVARQRGDNYDAKNAAYFDALSRNVDNNPETINSIVANAISAKERTDRAVREDYSTRFREAEYTAEIIDAFHAALQAKDANATVAAIENLMKRGDTDEVAKGLNKYSKVFNGNTPADLSMQKAISDSLMGYKGDNVLLAGYAKCLNMARGRAEDDRRKNFDRQQKGLPLKTDINPDFFSFDDYMNKNGQAAKYHLDYDTVISTMPEDVLTTQDRTFYKYGKDRDILLGNTTQRRNALYSGQAATAEKREADLDMYLGSTASWDYLDANGKSLSSRTGEERKILTFGNVYEDILDSNGKPTGQKRIVRTAAEQLAQARSNISNLIAGNNADHIMRTKSADLVAFYATMTDAAAHKETDAQGNETIVFDFRDNDVKNNAIRSGIQALIDQGKFDAEGIRKDLANRNKRGGLGGMNSNTRAIFNDVLHFSK